MNNVSLTGRLARDPETKQAGEMSVCNFTIAVNRNFAKEGQPNADFITCTAFAKTADFIQKYFIKGMGIGIIGEIRVDTYEKDGNKVWSTKVICNKVEFIEKKSKEVQTATTTTTDKNAANPAPSFDDDELPF